MKKLTGILVVVLAFAIGGVATAADVTISEQFPDGYVLNPVDPGETLVFGDVKASISSIEAGEDGNSLVTLEIVNNSRVSLWVNSDALLSFFEGRFNGTAGSDDAQQIFEVTSMETSEGEASVAYEWFMSVPAGGTGTVTLEVGPDVEKLCYRPFGLNQSGLTDAETQQIHGCWLLTETEGE